jgi:hypothetical protein
VSFLRRWFACVFRPHIHGRDIGSGYALHVWRCDRCGAPLMSHDEIHPDRCLPIDESTIAELRRNAPWFRWSAIMLVLLLASCNNALTRGRTVKTNDRFETTYFPGERYWILRDTKTRREYLVIPEAGIRELDPVPQAEIESK